MTSRIQTLIQNYNIFENLLPEELLKVDFNALKTTKIEIKSIIDEDLQTIRNLSTQKNIIIDYVAFKKPEYIVRMGFFREGDVIQENVQFYFAHWYMSVVTLVNLSNQIIKISEDLVKYYTLYCKTDLPIIEKKINYNHFARAWLDFFGYLVNIYQSIYNYYDLIVRTMRMIDPDCLDQPYYLHKSDEGPAELQAAVKELLLYGNRGRLAGFSLLRSMMDISIIRDLFEVETSSKYHGCKIIPKNKSISIKAICNRLDKLELSQVFKTDTLIRLYDWGSIVSHRGFRTDEYVTWFAYDVVAQLCINFHKNLGKYRDKILEELKRTNQIDIVQN